ncbi:MAG: dihydrodipicolinate synthase family protein [Terriglobia bacterium]|nr:dihydrodipicolinate synthase family protein [Terriglobia bacterium]
MNLSLGGVIPILPTPFTAAGEVDDEGFANVIEAAIAGGVNGLAMFGLASEYYKLADAERFHLVEVLVQKAAKRCPVVISIVPHATQLAVAEAGRAVEAGADAIMVMPPFFLVPPVDTIIRHIHDIAVAVPVPVIVQYAPLQTGRAIDMQAFAQLRSELPNITHIKVDLVPSGPTISNLRTHSMESLVGYMGLHLPEDFSRGVGGVMPTVSICPAFVKMWKLLAQDEKQARDLHREVLPFLNFMMQSIEFLIACEKELLVHRGILRSADCREPAYHLDSIQRSELSAHAIRLTSLLAQN